MEREWCPRTNRYRRCRWCRRRDAACAPADEPEARRGNPPRPGDGDSETDAGKRDPG